MAVLELGVLRGGSLRLWRDYFRKGTIVGLDRARVAVDDPERRIQIYQGSQDDTALLTRIAREHAPAGFDLIIDDASHVAALTRRSFWHLFEHHLKPGGLYVIEDWGMGYWSDWPDGAAATRASAWPAIFGAVGRRLRRKGGDVHRLRAEGRLEKGLEDVEFATLEWVAWYNGRRLLEPLGYVPPAEFEQAYHDRQAAPAAPAVLT